MLPEFHVGIVELVGGAIVITMAFAGVKFANYKNKDDISSIKKRISNLEINHNHLKDVQNLFERTVLSMLSEIKIEVAVAVSKIEELLNKKRGK